MDLTDRLAESMRLINTSDTKKVFECELCKQVLPHMVVIMSNDGDIHVHAPFDNRYIMTQFIDTIILEQKKHNDR